MRTPLYLTIAVLCAGLAAASAHAYTTGAAVPSTWGHWAGTAPNYQFVLDRPNVEWQTIWSDTNNKSSGNYNSGGEWYDIEGLYIDLYADSGSTYLSWLLVTGYSGVEPGEWTDFANWDLQKDLAQSVNHNTTYANIRDHGDPDPQYGTVTDWSYRSNPVIGLNLDGTAGLEWALILDTTEYVDSPTQFGGTPYDISTTAGLYKVDPLTKWIATPYNEYPAAQPSDVDIATTAQPGRTPATAAASGTSTKRLATDRSGLTDAQWGSNQLYDSAKILDGWPNPDMYYSWYWTGTINVSGVAEFASFLPGAASTSVHYAMWCGNDVVKPGWTVGLDDEEYLETTPELSSSALLLLGALPVGFGWWRRRKRA